MRSVLTKFVLSCVGLGVIASLASILCYGSLIGGIRAMEGKVMYAEQPLVVAAFPPGGSDLIACYRIKNLSSRPITLRGAEVNCGCIATSAFPLKIDGHQEKQIQFQVHGGGDAINAQSEYTMKVFSDEQKMPLALTILVKAPIKPIN